MHIGTKIKRIRQLKGYTQFDLAASINKTRALVSHIEQTGKINHYTLKAILDFFSISEEDLDSIGEGNPGLGEIKNAYSLKDKDNIDKIQNELDKCQMEISVLKELIESQKKVIRLLEEKKKT